MTCNRTSLNCHIAITLSITISKFEYSKTDCFWFTGLCVLAHVEIGTTMTTTKVQIITPQVSPLRWLFLAKHHQESPPHCLLLSLCNRNTGCGFQLESMTAVGQDACDLYSFVVGGPISWGLPSTSPLVFQRLMWTEIFQKITRSIDPHWLSWNTNVILFQCNFLGDSSSSQVCLQTPSPIRPP